jgi:hypothetical protein
MNESVNQDIGPLRGKPKICCIILEKDAGVIMSIFQMSY